MPVLADDGQCYFNADRSDYSSDEDMAEVNNDFHIGDFLEEDDILDVYNVEEEQNLEDDAQMTFDLHKAGVFGGSLHPFMNLVATGAEDDSAFLWDSTTGDILHQFFEHKDTVTDVYFSFDGCYLAIADMAGQICVHKVYNLENKLQLQKVWSYFIGDLAWMRWHHSTNILFSSSVEGEIYIWLIPSGNCKILPSRGKRCETGAITHDGKKLFVGYENGDVCLWDIKSCLEVFAITQKSKTVAHQNSIVAVECDKLLPLYMSGDCDGLVLICSNNGLVNSLTEDGAIESIKICPALNVKLAAIGTLNGKITIYDLSNHTLRNSFIATTDAEQMSSLIWVDDYNIIVATVNGGLRGYDVRTGQNLFKLNGHRSIIYEMSYNILSRTLLTTSEDTTAKLFLVPIVPIATNTITN